MRTTRTRAARVLALGLLVAAIVGIPANASVTRTLVPIGSDYQPDTLQLFAREAARADRDGTVHILVLPITYSLSGLSTTKSERKKNLTLADNRRGSVEDACNVVRSQAQTCLVELVPALVRADASDPAVLAFFNLEVDGMFSLGGDQGVAMQVVQATPLEAAMTAAYEAGAAFGGNSAGDAVQSRIMLNGYLGANGPAESMRQGVLDVRDDDPAWDGSTLSDLPTRGLAFGFPNLITDQHVYEYGRTGRSLNMSLQYGLPVLGMDAATGAVVTDYAQLRDVTGDTQGYVIDPGAWSATHAWGGPTSTLSARHVALHLVSPSDGFDFTAMLPSQDGAPAAKPDISGRTWPFASTGARPVYLSGGLLASPSMLVGDAFVADAGGSAARIVVLAAGYARNADAAADSKAIAARLAPSVASVQSFVLDSRLKTADALAALNAATGIVLTGTDPSLIKAQLAGPVWAAAQARWTASNAVLLADDAGAAVAGSTFVAQPTAADVEAGAIADAGGVTLDTGLGLVTGLRVQPRLLPDQHWPRLFRLVAPSAGVGAGIDVGTALRVSGTSATVVGASAVVTVDSRQAAFDTSTGNGTVGAAWLILDSFTDGQAVTP